MPKKKQTLKHIEERKNNYKDFDYSLIPDSYHYKDKVFVICKKCNEKFSISHASLINKTSKTIECKNKKCPSYRKYRIEESTNFLDSLIAENKSDFIFSDYEGYEKPLIYTCKKCNNDTPVSRGGRLKKVTRISCSFCDNFGGFKKNNSILDFQLKQKFGNDIFRVGDYINDTEKIDFFCNDCKTTFKISPGKLVQGRGCNNCTRSSGEKAVSYYLEKNNFHFIREYKRSIYYYDFYIPSLKCLIEFDGEQHYRPVRFNGITEEKAVEIFEKGQERDLEKNMLIESDEILLRISYKQKNT